MLVVAQPGAGQQPVAGSSRTVLAEVRRAFAPYPSTPSPGRSGRRQPLANQASYSGRSRARNWTHRIFCLGSPDDTVTPGGQLSALLEEHELGLRSINIG